MPYWRLYYHIVWATKNREPLIQDDLSRVIARSIRTTLESFKAVPHAIGMVDDHVHVAVSIPPAASVSDVVARMKGPSAHAVNDMLGNRSFAWQAEYGVLSFGERALADVIEYVTHQRERHAANRLWPTMEQIGDGKQPASAGLSKSARGLQPRANGRASDGRDNPSPGDLHLTKRRIDQ
jgi:putative transposase